LIPREMPVRHGLVSFSRFKAGLVFPQTNPAFFIVQRRRTATHEHGARRST
jgi:hypothetical protein